MNAVTLLLSLYYWLPRLVSGVALSLVFSSCLSVAESERTTPTVSVNPSQEVYLAPRPAQPRRKATYNSVHTSKPYIALTFDDGPHPVHTPKLLDTLGRERVKATFFVLGRLVEQYPEVARRIVREGHEIANHTWSHPNLAKMSDAAVERELTRTSAAIFKATGVRPTSMRPPFGAFTQRQRSWVKSHLDLYCIMWSVDPLDWKIRNAESVRSKLVGGAHNGAILLAHDIHPTTVQAMPGTIRQLKDRGFQFKTVAELIELEEAPPPPPQVASTQAAPADAR
ncbi:MAG: polysaccharide deacetylase family protein [Verrucomicrobiia bacterium]